MGVVVISGAMKMTSSDETIPENDEEESPDIERNNRTLRKLEVSTSDYVELGAAQMVIGEDGMPVVAGEPRPPSEGLSANNFVCAADTSTGRPACDYYAAVILTAEGTVKGFGAEKPRALRRFCTKLAAQSELMELTETEVFACTLRSPKDLASAAVIVDFETRQKKIAAEAAKTTDNFEI